MLVRCAMENRVSFERGATGPANDDWLVGANRGPQSGIAGRNRPAIPAYALTSRS